MKELLFPDFKSKALTFSYYDNTTQDRRLVKILRKYGIKATFFEREISDDCKKQASFAESFPVRTIYGMQQIVQFVNILRRQGPWVVVLKKTAPV